MKIQKHVVDNIFLQGEREAPLEACGYLAGKDGIIVKNFEMTNIDNSHDHFSLDPKEQFNVIRNARQEGLAIIAVYHTHPETPARPSEEDIKLAYDPNTIYVIASLAYGSTSIKAYRIIKGLVTQEELIIQEKL